MGNVGTSPSSQARVATAIEPSERITEREMPVQEPTVIVDITELVKANPLFLRLAAALRLCEDDARHMLKAAMDEAGTHAGIITAEDIWFMTPRIESDVIAHFVNQDASVRREQLNELLRRTRWESQNSNRRAPSTTTEKPKFLQRLGVARFA